MKSDGKKFLYGVFVDVIMIDFHHYAETFFQKMLLLMKNFIEGIC